MVISEKGATAIEAYSSECALPIANADKPLAPTVASYTEDSVTLNAESGCVYRLKGGSWKRITERFNSGSNSCVLMEFTNHEAKPIYIDDISLVNTADNSVLLYNDFEDGISGWYWPGGVSGEYYHSGTQSLRIGTGDYTRTFRCVDVEPNAEYEISFYCCVPEGSSWWGGGWYVNAVPSNVDRGNPVDYFYNGKSNSIILNRAYVKTGEWLTEPTFEVLSTGREYTFYSKRLATSAFSESEISEPFVFTIPAPHGDANADGQINGIDLALLKRLLLGFKADCNPDGCDSNGDTVINIKDLVSLKKRASGIAVKLSGKVSAEERRLYESSDIVQPISNEYERLGFSNEYEHLTARDGFIYGMDYDWFVTNENSGHHLADNHILSTKSAFAPELVYSELYNMHAMGYNAANVWLFNDGQGILFDSNGLVTGLDPNLLKICV